MAQPQFIDSLLPGNPVFIAVTLNLNYLLFRYFQYAFHLDDYFRFGAKVRKILTLSYTCWAGRFRGFYDENMQCSFIRQQPLSEVAGAELAEFKVYQNYFNINIMDICLRTHLWKGILKPRDARVLCEMEGEPLACENKYGQGRFIWVPTPLELAASPESLGQFYLACAPEAALDCTGKLDYCDRHLSCRMLETEDAMIYIITNTSDTAKQVRIRQETAGSRTLYGKNDINNGNLTVEGHGTAVVMLIKK